MFFNIAVAVLVACVAIVLYGSYELIQRHPSLIIQLINKVDNFADATEFNLKKNRYLMGSYRPVQEENYQQSTEIISGEIPDDVNGLFMRIGPNPKTDPSHMRKMYHVFDGDGMLHSLRLKDGKASYSNQWLRTPRYLIEEKYQQSLFLRIGEMKGIIGLIKILILQPLLNYIFQLRSILNGTANTALLFYKNKLYACHEGSLPYEIIYNEAKQSFDSNDYETLSGRLDHPISAHSRVDPIKPNEWFFNGYNLENEQNGMKYGRVINNTLVSYFYIPSKIKSFAHDMMITTNYVIFFESSVLFDTNGIMEGNFFKFSNESHMRIGIMSKDASNYNDVIWFQSNQSYSIIHGMNAWEVYEQYKNEIIINAHLGFDFDALNPESEFGENQFYLAQLRINLDDKAKELKVDFFDTETMTEFPNVHPEYFGRPTQFGFSGQFLHGDEGFTSLVKWDLFSREKVATLKLPDGLLAGEPIPIPKQGGEDVDDVYLAVFAHNRETIAGEWLLFDGKTMDNEPIVRISMKGKSVPNGFHGMWLPEEKLQAHLAYASTVRH